MQLLQKLLTRPFLEHAAVEYCLTSLVKLSARFSDQSKSIRVRTGEDCGCALFVHSGSIHVTRGWYDGQYDFRGSILSH